MSDTRVGRPKLSIVPCTREQAKNFVRLNHRHHNPSVIGIFCVACVDESGLVRGVAMVGRPVARLSCDGRTVEVNRVATDGCPNACSFLLGACRRIAFELGYTKILTYTLPAEGGRACEVPDGAALARRAGVAGRITHAQVETITPHQ